MQSELESALESNRLIEQQFEACNDIAKQYWLQLQQTLLTFTFCSVRDEIYFFKHFKPRFTSEIEYFSLLTSLERAVTCNEAMGALLHTERQRKDNFIYSHSTFYAYYRSGRCDLDESYFLRCNNRQNNVDHAKAYDMEEKACTSHDALVAEILALDKYDMYLKDTFTCD